MTPSDILEHLLNDWNVLYQLNEQEILGFFEAYKGKRLSHPSIRPALKSRLAHFNAVKRAERESEKLFNKVISIWQRVGHLHTITDVSKYRNYHARSIGNDLYDLPIVWSGFKSVELLSNVNQSECPEHFHPRQQSGLYIFDKITAHRAKYTFKDLCNDLCTFSHVHKVTSSENIKLKQYQTGNHHPRLAYRLAGIELVQCQHELNIEHSSWYHLLRAID